MDPRDELPNNRDELKQVLSEAIQERESNKRIPRLEWPGVDPALWGWLVVLGLVVAMMYVGLRNGGLETLVAFLGSTALFTISSLILLVAVLLQVWIIQKIRSGSWYDGSGAGTEMAKIRARIGTEYEQPGDARAVAEQYKSTTLLVAALYAVYFVIHHMGG